MRAIVPALLAVCALRATAADPVAAPGPAPDIPVTAVTLYSSGVGYFEHSGSVDGVATAELRFKTGQINDVLKSLVLQDLDKGSIGTVVYPSRDPLEKTLGSFQVDLRGAPTLAQLLGQLRGAAVQVTWQSERIAGTILGVETRTTVINERQTVAVPVLSVVSETGIRQVPLNEVAGLSLVDAKLQGELNRALAAVAGARDQDTKPVTLRFDGQGKRRVRLGYVVETPLWKVSYRLVLPDAKADAKTPAVLQGWAMVENQTDSDWSNVRLSLVSGRPVSFIQDLYSPRYLPRPTVEDEQFASLRPQAYERGDSPKTLAAPAAPAAAAAPMRKAGRAEAAAEADSLDGAAGPNVAVEARQEPLDPTASVRSVAQAGDLGVLFSYAVDAVTLPRQRSAMLPIVSDPLSAERVSIYDEAILAKHPLNGALLTNTTGKHLLQGPVTVFDGGAYGGDARIESLPPGGKRLISYAIDIPLTVDPQGARHEARLVSGKIVDGVLWTTQARVLQREYRFASEAETPRTVVLAHHRQDGWSLKDTSEPFETTPEVYRFRVAVPAGKSVAFTVTETITDQETWALVGLDDALLAQYLGNGAIPPKVRQALQQAAQLKAQVAEAERQGEAKQQEVQQIVQDQARLRENLRSVAANSPYAQRLLTKLNDQESKVEGLQTEGEQLHATAEARRKALADFLRGLNVE